MRRKLEALELPRIEDAARQARFEYRRIGRDAARQHRRGMAAERYHQTDCFQSKGMLGTLSHAWSVGVLLDACESALELGLA